MKPKSSVDRGHEPARVCAKIERKRTIDVRGWKTAKSCENALASRPFYSFVQPCNELLAETITARRTIRCVLVVSKHTATGIIHQGVTDSLLQNSPSFHRANIFILGFKRPRY